MGLLDRLFGRRTESTKLDATRLIAAAESVVHDYSVALMKRRGGMIADERELPHPKEAIKQAFRIVLRVEEDTKARQVLAGGYVYLADWQPDVGATPVGLDLASLDAVNDPMGTANAVIAMSERAAPFEAMAKKERAELFAELKAFERS